VMGLGDTARGLRPRWDARRFCCWRKILADYSTMDYTFDERHADQAI
jgi:hypothetical protein